MSGRVCQYDFPKQRERAKRRQVIPMEYSEKQVALFSHLPQFERSHRCISEKIMRNRLPIPPMIVDLGIKLAEGSIQGANARCLATLVAFRDFVATCKTGGDRRFGMELEKAMEPVIQFIKDCRPYSIGMGNLIRYIKRKIGRTMQMTATQSKQYLVAEIDRLVKERVVDAERTIANMAAERIADGETILTFARSNAVLLAFRAARQAGRSFRVVVVNANPRSEGRTLVEELAKEDIPVDYILINVISYVINQVTKVMIGAHTIMSNGNVYNRAGTALVCMMAAAHNLPVLVACETYKFCERIQIDSICHNELDDPENLLRATDHRNDLDIDPLADWRQLEHLKLLNLIFDLTPADFISMVITELGYFPPTSVPAVIREFYATSN